MAYLFFRRGLCAASLILLAFLAARPLASQANLDGWNPAISPALTLDQGWKFVWNHLIGPEDQNDAAIAALKPDTRPLHPSWRWSTHQDAYPDLPASGFGTYLLKVRLPADTLALREQRLTLELGKVSSSARIFWNGQLVGNFGAPGTSAAATLHLMKTGLFELPLPTDPAVREVWLAIQVANYTDNYPGMQATPRIGAWESLELDRDLSIATTFIMTGLFLIMAIYHLFLFLFRWDERAPLYFAIICLILAVRILVTDQLFVMILAPRLHISIVWATSYLTFTLLVASFAFFTTNIFRYSWSPVIRWVAAGGSLAYSVLVVATPSLFYTQLMEVFQVFCLVMGLAMTVLVVVAIVGHRPHARLFAVGLFFVLGTTVFDIIKTDLQLPYPSTVPLGMVVFVFVLALVLTRKSAQQLAVSERLNLRLQRINSSMIRFVPRGFLQLIQKADITTVSLGDNSRDVLTVMDIRYLPDPELARDSVVELEHLNRFIGYMVPIIRTHGGTAINFRSDGLQAVFPAEVAPSLDAALAIVNAMAEPKSRLGIGLHHGTVLLATIGEAQHLETALFADTVQVAANLAKLCLELGATILASASSVQRLRKPENYNYRMAGSFRLGEAAQPQAVAEFYDGEGQEQWRRKRETKKGFEFAVHLYLQKRYPEARSAFEQHLSQFPSDSLARHYLRLMQQRQAPALDQSTKLP